MIKLIFISNQISRILNGWVYIQPDIQDIEWMGLYPTWYPGYWMDEFISNLISRILNGWVYIQPDIQDIEWMGLYPTWYPGYWRDGFISNLVSRILKGRVSYWRVGFISNLISGMLKGRISSFGFSSRLVSSSRETFLFENLAWNLCSLVNSLGFLNILQLIKLSCEKGLESFQQTLIFWSLYLSNPMCKTLDILYYTLFEISKVYTIRLQRYGD